MNVGAVVRKIDEHGRIVLPLEIRRTLMINWNDPLEVLLDGAAIALRKNQAGCIFCNVEENNARVYMGKCICKACMTEIRDL